MEQREFLAKAKSLIDRAAALIEKVRREGLLTLEGELDDNICKFAGMGLRMVFDGYQASDIDKVLTNMLARETNEEERRLKAMWREAVLLIQAGYNTRVLTCDSQDLICYSRTIRRPTCQIHNRAHQKLIFIMTVLFFRPRNSLLGKELRGVV